jgi:NAD(P)-dependent dehydrogenase (short-subunit alcohol dehydrogenase family)
VATARDPTQLAGLVERYGDQVHPFALDVTDPQAAGDAIAAAVEAFSRLDVLVNNAGYGDRSASKSASSNRGASAPTSPARPPPSARDGPNTIPPSERLRVPA